MDRKNQFILISKAGLPEAGALAEQLREKGCPVSLTDAAPREFTGDMPGCLVVFSADGLTPDEISAAASRLSPAGGRGRAVVLSSYFSFEDLGGGEGIADVVTVPFDLGTLRDRVMLSLPGDFDPLSDPDNLTVRTAVLLRLLGYKPRRKGFELLRDAVAFTAAEGRDGLSLKDDIYPMLSARYGTGASAAERSVRMLNGSVWSSASPHMIKEIFGTDGFENGIPGSKKIIAALADYVARCSADEIRERLSGE